jgi:hypothetical protein
MSGAGDEDNTFGFGSDSPSPVPTPQPADGGEQLGEDEEWEEVDLDEFGELLPGHGGCCDVSFVLFYDSSSSSFFSSLSSSSCLDFLF